MRLIGPVCKRRKGVKLRDTNLLRGLTIYFRSKQKAETANIDRVVDSL